MVQVATPSPQESEHLFTCNLCEAQCGLRVSLRDLRITGVRGDPKDLLSRGHVCPKAVGLRDLMDDPDRLRQPMIRTSAGWAPASWEDALDMVATKLTQLRGTNGVDSVALYVGNPVVHSHRSSLAAQLLTVALKTKNRFDPNSQDSNPRLFACMQMYGDALSLPVPDIDRTNFLFMLGANPAVSNGSQMGLGDPRRRFEAIRERGGRVVLIDPRRTESAAWSTEHHFIRPDGDAPLLLAMLHVIYAEGLVHPRVSEVASGVKSLGRLASKFSPERVGPAIGIAAHTIRDLARDFATADGACAYSRVGVCQSAFGPVASWLVEALNVVTGNLDRPGGAMFPTPAADVAPLGRMLVGNHFGRWRSRVRGLPEFLGAIPSAAMAEEIETEGTGQVRGLVTMAGNPVLSTPNGARLDRALGSLEFMVSIDYYLNETTRHAHVILPPKHIFETGNYDLILSRFCVRNVAKYSPPIVSSSDNTRDDWEIATEIALRLAMPGLPRVRGMALSMSLNLPEQIVDLLLRFGPHKTSLAALRAAPHGIDFGPLVPSLREHVHTPDRRVRLMPETLTSDIPRLESWIDKSHSATDLLLIGRRHLRSNNSWMHNLPSLAKGPDRTKLLVHPLDASRLGVVEGATVRLRSRVGEVLATATISDQVMPGVVSLPHGFGHQGVAATLKVAGALHGCNANVLTDEERVEPVVGTSMLSGVPVTVERVDAT